MSTFADIYQKHSISKMQQSSVKPLLIKRLSLLSEIDVEDEYVYAFRIFLDHSSLKYFNTELAERIVEFFEENTALSIEAFEKYSSEISKAGFSLLRDKVPKSSEESLTLDSPDDISKFDTLWHPAYQRTCEHVFNHFIKIPLYVLGQLRSKDYISLALSNRSKILQEHFLAESIAGYNSVVRNAISHGGIEYLHGSIRYIDSRDSIEMFPHDFAKLLDALTDECGAYLFASILFLTRQCRKKQAILSKIPLIHKHLLLSGLANHPRLHIHHLYESVTINNDYQLNIQCTIGSKSRSVHLFESLYIAYLIQTWFQNTYSRIAISIDCCGSINASIFINGKALSESIEAAKSIEESKDVLETNMLWYDTSGFFRHIYFWLCLLQLQKQLYFYNLYKKWEEIGITATNDRYKIRYIENRSAGKLARSAGIIVLADGYSYDLESLQKVIRHAAKRIHKNRVRRVSIPKHSIVKYKPTHFWFRIFLTDRRLRELKQIENINKDLLVSKVEFIKNTQKTKPIVVLNPDIIDRKLRIQFNPKYVKQA